MCRLILTAGLCLIIAVLASATHIDQFCNGKKNGDYANPNDPNSYITCSNGLTYVRYCQAGLIFRESLDICDWPTTTSFTSTLKTTTKTTTPGPVDQFCKGKRDGDYTNPKNQYTFYTCSNGLTYLRDCPAGLIFRESTDRCDWPTPAVPSGTPSTATTTACAGTIDHFCKGKGDGDYTNPNNQYTFYTCSNGLTYLRDCPAGLIFRECLDRCDGPTTPCFTTPKTTTKTTTPGPIDEFCKGKRDGDYTNPKNQYTFYTCSNGLTFLRDCPAGLIFNESLDICDWPTAAVPSGTNPTATTTASAGTIDQFCQGKRDGDYTNPKNQYTFYTCSNGRTFLRDCPAGLIFRESTDRCDWPTAAVPSGTPSTATTTACAGTTDQFCKGKRDGDYTNPKNQYTFYTCSNGLTYIRDCPAGLIFRECLDRCDWPTTPCFTTTTTTTKPPTPGPVNQFCKGKSDGDYTNPRNPNSYITCSNGLTYVRDCPAGLIFRQCLDRCDGPTTPCFTTPKTTTKTTTPGPIDEFCKGKRDGDYTNPKNQYTFYTCSNGLTYLRDCPAGLIFRESTDRCDWPTTPAPSDKTPTATKTTTAKGKC
ncbi:Chondroitin proteoglycan 2 Precursor [Channa argus]|uniref:chitinase n=1 Tax=Channa argus TaxID=215402 RepID=A0A6G1PU49_CHAAH|nr:Chondroitin proteoglycan 2 Precursor [Channa argus]